MKKVLFVLFSSMILFACKKTKDSPNPPGSSRNQWDGRYRLEGTMTDFVNADFRWKDNSYQYTLQSSGTASDSLVSNDLGFPGIVIANLANATYYSRFGLVFNFDAATNKVTSVTNYYGQPSSNGRSAVLDPTGINSVDPVSKNIRVKIFMDETGLGSHRTSFDLTLVYLGARP